jgi:hypothetical protein
VLIKDFWQIVEQARSDSGTTDEQFDANALAASLVERLAALTRDEILDFDECFQQLRSSLEQWEVCAACFLIAGYISDDTFTDFKAGIIALGRTDFERIAEDPDSLAEHPVVVGIAEGRLKRTALNSEALRSAAPRAYTRLSDGDDEAYWEEVHARDAAAPPRQRRDWDGRFGAAGDGDLLPVRVPRLAAMFASATPSA